LKKFKIVFVTSEGVGVHSFESLAHEAQTRGHEVVFSDDPLTQGDIGFYCDDHSRRGKQTLAVISINGLDQDHVDRPDYHKWFSNENWSEFDLGILPGPRWSRGWQAAESCGLSVKHGVLVAGWPKSDKLFSEVDPLVNKLRSGHLRRVLYAPQTEQDGKQSELIRQLEGRNVSLSIKHWENESYVDRYPTLLTASYLRNLEQENEAAAGKPWVDVIDPCSNFMDLLPCCDLLITDQSSVLYEAVLVGAPTLIVGDWKHACGVCGGPQPSPDACAVTTQQHIGNAVDEIFSNYNYWVHKALLVRTDNFVNLGFSSKVIIDSVEHVYRCTVSTEDMRTVSMHLRPTDTPHTYTTHLSTQLAPSKACPRWCFSDRSSATTKAVDFIKNRLKSLFC
jgi:hypothetical protein